MKELLRDFDNAKIIVWTKDKVLFGKVKNGEVEFQSGISTLNKYEILEFRAFDGARELYFWGDNSRLYEFKGDEINSTTKMLGKVVDCKNCWSKVDDGRGGKFYLPLERQKGYEIIIEKCDIIDYHKQTNQAYIKGYAIKEIR